MRRRTVLVCVVLALVLATSATAQLGKVLEGGGIAFVVSKFGSDINKFINRLTKTPDQTSTYATKVVPIISAGNGTEVGAAQVSDLPRLILKRGERGATVFEHGTRTEVPPVPVEVVNGLGAGDAFAAAVGQALLSGHSLVDAVRRGTVAGAIVAGRLACSEAMPSLDELEASLASSGA